MWGIENRGEPYENWLAASGGRTMFALGSRRHMVAQGVATGGRGDQTGLAATWGPPKFAIGSRPIGWNREKCWGGRENMLLNSSGVGRPSL